MSIEAPDVSIKPRSVSFSERKTIGSRPSLPIDILSLDDALHLLGREWDALERAIPTPTLFQSVAWAGVYASWRKTSGNGGLLPTCYVLSARDADNQLIGLWPLQLERQMGVTYAVGLGDPFNQYNDILIHPEADAGRITEAMMLALESLNVAAGVIMRKVRDDSACASFLAYRGRALNATAAPSVNLRDYATFEDYHRTIKPKTRKNLRNARNRLARAGDPLVHVVHQDPESIVEAAQRAFELRTAWLDKEGLTSRAFLASGFTGFVRELCDAFASTQTQNDGLRLIAFELRRGDEMVSIQWGFIHKRYYYAFIAVRNPAFDQQSPGRLHLEDVIRSCAARDIDVVDFLAPDVDYKRTWATDITPIHDYGIGFSARGRVSLEIAHGAPRAYAKQMFDTLPRGLRLAAIRVMSNRNRGS